MQNGIKYGSDEVFVVTMLKLESIFVMNFNVPTGKDADDASNADRMDKGIAESNRLASESGKLHGVRCLHVCSGNVRLQHTTHTHYMLGMLI